MRFPFATKNPLFLGLTIGAIALMITAAVLVVQRRVEQRVSL